MKALNAIPGGHMIRRITMAGGTFAVAMGAGFFMQQGDASAGRDVARPDLATAPVTAPTAALQTVSADVTNDVETNPVLDDVTFEAVLSDAETVAPTVANFDPDTAPDTDTPEFPAAPAADTVAAEGSSCDPFMSARAMDAALVQLTLAAPCHSAQPLTVHHEGLMFTATTDASGNARIMAPALREEAMFIAAFDDGTGAIAETSVSDLVNYDRVVLQWQGDAGFEVHAMEFGANYGEQGHVWREAAREATDAATGTGGFLLELGQAVGDAPLLAEVYTFPSGKAPQAGTISLSVEAEITVNNCAKDVSAQTLERTADASVRIADLTLSIPECEAIGEFLVLRDLLTDLTLAQG